MGPIRKIENIFLLETKWRRHGKCILFLGIICFMFHRASQHLGYCLPPGDLRIHIRYAFITDISRRRGVGPINDIVSLKNAYTATRAVRDDSSRFTDAEMMTHSNKLKLVFLKLFQCLRTSVLINCRDCQVNHILNLKETSF